MLVAARDSSRCARRLLHENDEFMLHCGQWIALWALCDGGCNGLAGVCQSRRSTWTRHTCRRSGHHNQTSSACIVAGDDLCLVSIVTTRHSGTAPYTWRHAYSGTRVSHRPARYPVARQGLLDGRAACDSCKGHRRWPASACATI